MKIQKKRSKEADMVNVKVEVKFLSKWVVGLFVSLILGCGFLSTQPYGI